ncbi:NfeD-like C-terminal, partner-binding [Salinibacillus kushneri]|uniref:NfeD-like C-terminal, partner-binding n=1 Tax=Salinibacillus kushneri TaxID=237682 RepID=A0A1I0FZW8_9BACI|nr:NfeD family protein [Salinibacillus kushneri]SET63105.1 NfeD-like C-terminal, partner-binding [Salinibacillus kushneri]
MFLSSSFAALMLTFLGFMLLMGEMFVKLRGVSGVLGFGFILLYFQAHLESINILLVAFMFILAIMLIIIDGNITNDGTLSVIAILMMIMIVGLIPSNWVTGGYGITGLILGTCCSFLFLKVFPSRNMWDKITLFDRLTDEAGYNVMNESYEKLIGKKGKTVTELRPAGTIRIGEEEYSAVSDGKWIDRQTRIVVTHVDGTKIMVDASKK